MLDVVDDQVDAGEVKVSSGADLAQGSGDRMQSKMLLCLLLVESKSRCMNISESGFSNIKQIKFDIVS